MKLTSTEARQYGDLRVKIANGQASAADMKAYDALVVKMAKPEPRKKAATKKKATKS